MGIPYGLSILANHDPNTFVPGINDIIEGVSYTPEGERISTVSYADRITLGKKSHEALLEFDRAMAAGDTAAMAKARADIKDTYRFFGYGYFSEPDEALPPVGVTFYAFRIMVMAGGYLLLFLLVALWSIYRRQKMWDNRLWQWIAILSIPVVYICSQAGWVTAEVGRQPWIIQDLMPTRAAISDIPAGSVMLTFWIFAAVFTALLIAEMAIMIKQINKKEEE